MGTFDTLVVIVVFLLSLWLLFGSLSVTSPQLSANISNFIFSLLGK